MLDEQALARALAADPDGTLALVADLVHATDESLRAQARRLAARLVIDRSREGRAVRAGTARPRNVPASRGGDLDVDASLDAILTARGERRPADLDELTARDWGRQDVALCLLVDASGSMSGERLAVAATVTAACALRAPAQHAVIAFAGDVRTLRPLHGGRPAAAVVDQVLGLRGHGVTRLADALRAASAELATARGAAPGGGAALGLPAHRRGPGAGRPAPSRSWSCWPPATTPTRRPRSPRRSVPAGPSWPAPTAPRGCSASCWAELLDGLPGDAEKLSLPMGSSPWEATVLLHHLVNGTPPGGAVSGGAAGPATGAPAVTARPAAPGRDPRAATSSSGPAR